MRSEKQNQSGVSRIVKIVPSALFIRDHLMIVQVSVLANTGFLSMLQ